MTLEKQLEENTKIPSIDEITACIATTIPRPSGDPPNPPNKNESENSLKRKVLEPYKAAALSIQSILKRHKT